MDEVLRIVPHSRTLRKARENIKWMVADGLSAQKIKRYFSRWLHWWVRTSNTWQYQELLQWFMNVCWLESVSHYAAALYQLHLTSLRNAMPLEARVVVAA